ncbi:MAG TPA: hypothetical protein VFE82_19725 [Ramlibacter sp.]|jgi:hypothetical protein|nr:hypothetical protein [Ramlibacter sp.]HZY20711.1 hypothetical protein [Ramlibacter sp.]
MGRATGGSIRSVDLVLLLVLMLMLTFNLPGGGLRDAPNPRQG